MSNDYFSYPALSAHVLARARDVNSRFTSVQAGFALLPTKDNLTFGMTVTATAAGTGDAATVSMPKTWSSYTAGASLTVIWPANNTGAATLNVDGLGARDVKAYDGTDPAADDLVSGAPVPLVYDGTNFVMLAPSLSQMAGIASTLGANLTFTGNNTFEGANTFSGNNILSGDNTFSGTNTHTGTEEFDDDAFTLRDEGDATKKVMFQLSGITTGNTRTLTVPDASTTLVGTDTTQTLTNKTLTAAALSGATTVSGTVDGRDIATDGTKLDGIESGATADQTGAEIKAAYEAEADTNALTDARAAKIDHLTVTQAVDLDAMETRLNELDASVVLMGTFDASAGSFPGGGTAQAGESWIVSVSGTIDGVELTENDRVVAITDNASTSTYASNWHHMDYTDKVNSVVGLTGTISKAGLLSALNVEDGADVTDATNVTAAGALMDSECTNLAALKALDQGVATTDGPTFGSATITGDLTVDTTTLHVDATNNRVGVGTLSPSYPMTIRGGGDSLELRGTAVGSTGGIIFTDGDETEVANISVAGGSGRTEINVDPNSDFADSDFFIYVDGTQRFKFDASDNIIKIGKSTGTTDPISSNLSDSQAIWIRGNGQTDITDGDLPLRLNRSGGSSGPILQFRRNGTAVGSVNVTASATSYNESSDYRLKQEVGVVERPLERAMSLPVRSFEFKIEPGVRRDGFIAHELAEVVDYAVTGEKDAVDEKGEIIAQGVDYSKLVPLLAAALQEVVPRLERIERLAQARLAKREKRPT